MADLVRISKMAHHRMGIAGAALVLGWLGFEAVVLNGETVVDEHYAVGSALIIPVDEAGATYRVTIGRREGRSGGRKRNFAYRLEGPAGERVHQDTDGMRRFRRAFTFEPVSAGTHTLVVSDAVKPGAYAGEDFSWVKVEKNDSTVLLRLVGL